MVYRSSYQRGDEIAVGASGHKRRFQFGLRSILVVMTLFCLLIGAVAQPLLKARKHRQLLAQLEDLGARISSQGSVMREYSVGQQLLSPFGSKYDRDYLYRIDFSGASIVDDDLALLEQLPYLYRLNLSGTKVTDTGIDSVAACSTLYELDLSNTQVTDAGALKLRSLQSLAWLKTTGTAVTYDALTELDTQLPWTNSAEQRAIVEIAAYGGQAHGIRRSLENTKSSGPVYPGVFVFQGGEELGGGDVILGMNRKLKLGSAEISHLAHLDSLKHLNIFDVTIEPNSFANVPAIANLIEIEIWHTDITDAELKDLTRQTQLKRLTIENCKLVTDQGILELAKLRNLEYLRVGSGCLDVTRKSITYLREQLPQCEISHSKW